jgi:triosephosphate isomerase
MNKKIIVANWKMNPQTLAESEQILDLVNEYLESAEYHKELSLIFCPPFVFLERVAKILSMSHLSHQSELGAQDISWENEGAMTGEISGPMLKGLGVRYVIIGHSERRFKIGESDEVVNRKLKAALTNELIPVVCVGEKERDNNFKDFLRNQILNTFKNINANEFSRSIIAYEPVWAISSNFNSRPDTPESALESIEAIKEILIKNFGLDNFNLPRILYGGSINSSNVQEFLKVEKINGVLVGGASVKKDEFIKILSAVRRNLIG